MLPRKHEEWTKILQQLDTRDKKYPNYIIVNRGCSTLGNSNRLDCIMTIVFHLVSCASTFVWELWKSLNLFWSRSPCHLKPARVGNKYCEEDEVAVDYEMDNQFGFIHMFHQSLKTQKFTINNHEQWWNWWQMRRWIRLNVPLITGDRYYMFFHGGLCRNGFRGQDAMKRRSMAINLGSIRVCLLWGGNFSKI